LTALMTMNELQPYSKSGAIVQEVFSSIRTVFAYNSSEYEQLRYNKYLDSCKHESKRKGILFGCYMAQNIHSLSEASGAATEIWQILDDEV
ncbi:unnamed protein product, partial [Didymodactylos carnosus]